MKVGRFFRRPNLYSAQSSSTGTDVGLKRVSRPKIVGTPFAMRNVIQGGDGANRAHNTTTDGDHRGEESTSPGEEEEEEEG